MKHTEIFFFEIEERETETTKRLRKKKSFRLLSPITQKSHQTLFLHNSLKKWTQNMKM